MPRHLSLEPEAVLGPEGEEKCSAFFTSYTSWAPESFSTRRRHHATLQAGRSSTALQRPLGEFLIIILCHFVGGQWVLHFIVAAVAGLV